MGRTLLPPDRSRRSRAELCPTAAVMTGSPDLNPRHGRISLDRFEGGYRARIPQPWSFRGAAGSGEQPRTSPFGAGGDDLHRHVISARLDSDFAATVGDRPIAHRHFAARGGAFVRPYGRH